MHYTGPVIRPPYEAGSVMLEVTVGCTHDSCTFCTYYKGHPFRPAPLEQVRADLAEIARFRPGTDHIWAAGGDPFSSASTCRAPPSQPTRASTACATRRWTTCGRCTTRATPTS